MDRSVAKVTVPVGHEAEVRLPVGAKTEPAYCFRLP